MKRLLLAITLGAFFSACESAPKKEGNKAADTKVETKAKTDKKADAKAEKKPAKKANFEDEDISKSNPTAKTESAAMGKITCVSGTDSRDLEMTAADGKACVLNYTKQGNTQEVASGVADTNHCNEVRDRIKGKLEAAGFKCE